MAAVFAHPVLDTPSLHLRLTEALLTSLCFASIVTTHDWKLRQKHNRCQTRGNRKTLRTVSSGMRSWR